MRLPPRVSSHSSGRYLLLQRVAISATAALCVAAVQATRPGPAWGACGTSFQHQNWLVASPAPSHANTPLPREYTVVYATWALLGFVQGPLPPITLEHSAEMTFPLSPVRGTTLAAASPARRHPTRNLQTVHPSMPPAQYYVTAVAVRITAFCVHPFPGDLCNSSGVDDRCGQFCRARRADLAACQPDARVRALRVLRPARRALSLSECPGFCGVVLSPLIVATLRCAVRVPAGSRWARRLSQWLRLSWWASSQCSASPSRTCGLRLREAASTAMSTTGGGATGEEELPPAPADKKRMPHDEEGKAG